MPNFSPIVGAAIGLEMPCAVLASRTLPNREEEPMEYINGRQVGPKTEYTGEWKDGFFQMKVTQEGQSVYLTLGQIERLRPIFSKLEDNAIA